MDNKEHYECINKSGWYNRDIQEVWDGPRYGEVVTLQGVNPDGYLIFYEYTRIDEDGDQESYNPAGFRKLSPRLLNRTNSAILGEEVKHLTTKI